MAEKYSCSACSVRHVPGGWRRRRQWDLIGRTPASRCRGGRRCPRRLLVRRRARPVGVIFMIGRRRVGSRFAHVVSASYRATCERREFPRTARFGALSFNAHLSIYFPVFRAPVLRICLVSLFVFLYPATPGMNSISLSNIFSYRQCSG